LKVVTAQISISIPGSTSLKEKRKVLRSLTDRVRARFNVAIAEVDDLDLHNRSQLGIASVGGTLTQARELTEAVVRFIEDSLDRNGTGEIIGVTFYEY
jgi:uncharacterized protein YlxP (DUF503 family)